MNLIDCSRRNDRVIPRLLAVQARDAGDAVWLRQDERRVTFSEANSIACSVANALIARGLRKGETVAVLCPTSLDTVLFAVGIMKAGGIFAPISNDYRGQFLEAGLEASKSRFLVIHGRFAERLAELGNLGAVEHVFVHDGEAAVTNHGSSADLFTAPDHEPEVEVLASDPSMVWWSSGTTGRPKGVLHTHGSVLMTAWNNSRRDHQPGDILYCCTPMSLGSPWNFAIWPSLISGIPSVIDERFSVSRYWDRVRYYGATQSILLGAMHQHLWKLEPRPDDADNPLRLAFYVPMKYEEIPLFKKRFGIAVMHQAYGTSEGGTIFEARDDGTPWHGRAVGKPMPHLDVQLVDENDDPVAPGEVGELCIRPKHPDVMFRGYFNDAENTVNSCLNLWYHVGDTMYCDADGTYYFAGRKKDYVRYKGRNMSLNEIERAVERFSDLFEVAAFGVPADEVESEEEVGLAVVRRPGTSFDAATLARWINDNCPYYFVPRYIIFWDRLPRNGHGRLQKDELQAAFSRMERWDREACGFELRK